jgi:hypothetical protein
MLTFKHAHEEMKREIESYLSMQGAAGQKDNIRKRTDESTIFLTFTQLHHLVFLIAHGLKK